jgi:hypothetical protein
LLAAGLHVGRGGRERRCECDGGKGAGKTHGPAAGAVSSGLHQISPTAPGRRAWPRRRMPMFHHNKSGFALLLDARSPPDRHSIERVLIKI